MKILYLIESDDPGGAENVVLSLAEYFKKFYKVYIGCFKKGWIYQESLKKKFNSIIIPTNNRPIDINLLYNLIQFIKKENITLIHSHLFDTNFYSSLAARIARVPHISTEHGDIHLPTKKLNLRTKLKGKSIGIFSNKIVFVSKYTKKKFLEIAEISDKKIEVIYNGISLEEFRKPIDITKKKKDLGIKDDEFVIGNVASLSTVKGQIFLIRAAGKIIKDIPNIKFIIVGRGPLESKLKEISNKLDIDSNVIFTGYREDAKDIMRIMDIFVLPSLSEGLPLSLIEALASKVSIIATDVGGNSEIIDDGVNGYLIPACNSELLAERIICLLKSRDLRINFSKNAFDKAEKLFNIQFMLKKYEEIYKELCELIK